jgi:hypothetical protein
LAAAEGGGVVLVVEIRPQERLDVRVTFQDTEEFRPGIAAIADNSDLWAHDVCLFVPTNKYTTKRAVGAITMNRRES